MAKYSVSTRFSRDVVTLLVNRGMSLTEIAEVLGVTKSYISRVKSGTRKFTLDHLEILEDFLQASLPVLIMEATPRESVRPELRPLHDMTLKLLRSVGSGAHFAKLDTKSRRGRKKVA